MRTLFQEEIAAINGQVVAMAGQVEDAMSDATVALLRPDGELAQAVVARDRGVDERRWAIEGRVVDLIARQQPVASDLRLLIGALRLASELERMGDLASHIAAAALMRLPEPAVPPGLRDIIAAMGRVASGMAVGMRELLADRTLVTTMDLDRDDDAMDQLHRQLFTRLLACQPPTPVETAIDVTLIGRYYERFADHAVTVSRQVLFVVTGGGPATALPDPDPSPLA
jgi:phosphate transport system protein